MNTKTVFLLILFFGLSMPGPALPAKSYSVFQINIFADKTASVDFGSKSSKPSKDITIISGAESASAKFKKTVKICKDLCGEQSEKQCHFEGSYLLTKDFQANPDSVIAVVGSHRVTQLKVLNLQPIAAPELEKFIRLVQRKPPLQKCTGAKVDTLTLINCEDQGGLSWIFEGDQILANGFGDHYSSGQSKIIASFKINGEFAYLVYVDKKTHGAPGILIRWKGSWKLFHALTDYPHMC